MMEVNRLNPTKSIRIGGISHFAFVNGWLLRGWGRSCIAGDASKARLCFCRLAAAVGTYCGRRRCNLLRFVEKAVLRKRKEPHCWGSEDAMDSEEDFVLAMRLASRDCTGFQPRRTSSRLCGVSGWICSSRGGFSRDRAGPPSVTSFTRLRWVSGCAGFPTVLAAPPVRLHADGLRRTRKYAGTSARVRFWGARRSVRGCLAPRFRLHRRTEHGRQRRGRTAFRG